MRVTTKCVDQIVYDSFLVTPEFSNLQFVCVL